MRVRVRARSPEARAHEGEEGWGEGFVAREPHIETLMLSLDYGAALSLGLASRRLDIKLVWADRRVMRPLTTENLQPNGCNTNSYCNLQVEKPAAGTVPARPTHPIPSPHIHHPPAADSPPHTSTAPPHRAYPARQRHRTRAIALHQAFVALAHSECPPGSSLTKCIEWKRRYTPLG